MENKNWMTYEAPAVEVVEVEVEKGFASSTEDLNDPVDGQG